MNAEFVAQVLRSNPLCTKVIGNVYYFNRYQLEAKDYSFDDFAALEYMRNAAGAVLMFEMNKYPADNSYHTPENITRDTLQFALIKSKLGGMVPSHGRLCVWLQLCGSVSGRTLEELDVAILHRSVDINKWTNIRSAYLSHCYEHGVKFVAANRPLDPLPAFKHEQENQAELVRYLREKIDAQKNEIDEKNKEIDSLKSQARQLTDTANKQAEKITSVISNITAKYAGKRPLHVRAEIIKAARLVFETEILKITNEVCDNLARGLEMPDEILCIICMDAPRNVIAKKCGHCSICMECANLSPNCPTCRMPAKYRKIFLS